ncbi:MAG: flagellin [Parvularculaceae bacterium]
MVISVTSNPGALAALSTLTSVTADLEETQRRVSTGLEVSSARDNPALFSLAQIQRAELGSIESVQQGLRTASSTVELAIAAGDGISDILVELRQIATQAATADATTIDLLEAQYVELANAIDRQIASAEINGNNLLATAGGDLEVLASTDSTDTITVAEQDLEGTSILTIDRGTTPFDGTDLAAQQAAAVAEIAAIDASIVNLSNALGQLGAGSAAIDLQDSLLTRVSDALEVSIGNLTAADLPRESSRLQALQVQPQLAIQTLSIANAAPNAILGLFA